MKIRIWGLIFLAFAAVLFGSCKALVDECETNNTGTFYIENASSSGKAYEIHIDGINYGIVGAGQTKEWNLAAGPHVVQILFADSDKTACSLSAPTVIKCKKTGLRCDA
jgi:hypothetical protein